jgi:hypothetical protein
MSVQRKAGGSVRAAMILGTLGGAFALPIGPANAQLAQYNGVYAGTETLTTDPADHNYSQCLKGPFKRKMTVTDGKAVFIYNPGYAGQVSGIVSAEGDVSGSVETSSGGVALAGKIQGDAFTGKVWSIICTYSLDLKRVP